MKVDKGGNLIWESTGRVAHAEMGLVSINEDGGLYEGNDSSWSASREPFLYEGSYDASAHPLEMTDIERAELADFMIARWEKFKA